MSDLTEPDLKAFKFSAADWPIITVAWSVFT